MHNVCIYLYMSLYVDLSLCTYICLVYECVYLHIIFKSWRKWKGKSLGQVGEITGTKRERKTLALRKDNKAKNKRIRKDRI